MIYIDILEFKKELSPNHRLLCLDVGMVRTGYAFSDKRKILSTGHGVFNLKKQKFTSSTLLDIIETKESYGIVIGYPLQMGGTPGKSCLMVDKFISKFLLCLEQPIFLQDERLSTSAVNRYFKEMDLTRKKQSEESDKAAACYILQTTLERLRN